MTLLHYAKIPKIQIQNIFNTTNCQFANSTHGSITGKRGVKKKILYLSELGSACLEVTQRALECCCREKLIVELRGDMHEMKGEEREEGILEAVRRSL